jgi:hypothetical protein
MKADTPSRAPSLDDVFARSETMVGRRIAGEFVLVPLVGHGAQLDSIFNLNRVGALIWQQLDSRRSGLEIVGAIVERFQVDRATAQADYLRFLAKLGSIGAVHRVVDDA